MTVTGRDGTRLYIFESIFKEIIYQKVAIPDYMIVTIKIKSNLKIPSLKTPK